MEVDAHGCFKEPEGKQCRAHGGLLLVQQPPRGQPTIRMPLVELVLGLHSRQALYVQRALRSQLTNWHATTGSRACRSRQG